ncbi:hypothetical protein BDP55DRAFT_212352 [Colletotrichum godetiae]|uniref:Uncharacterized protein n=1 Tax=Colletotrichum godetiae TaxID=1209918 RepID=A0AAJ0F1S1_9PEZI|nr:uncharacterized protein BDP55DRAFT_212352 [Colletotrichum godetiae]KAK1699944.1 hypothetical protein BDP55DRAFT_212352 [Colletotrichum godetiae]
MSTSSSNIFGRTRLPDEEASRSSVLVFTSKSAHATCKLSNEHNGFAPLSSCLFPMMAHFMFDEAALHDWCWWFGSHTPRALKVLTNQVKRLSVPMSKVLMPPPSPSPSPSPSPWIACFSLTWEYSSLQSTMSGWSAPENTWGCVSACDSRWKEHQKVVRASHVSGSLCQVLLLLLQAPGTPPPTQQSRWLCKQSTLNNQYARVTNPLKRMEGGEKGVRHLSSSLLCISAPCRWCRDWEHLENQQWPMTSLAAQRPLGHAPAPSPS